MKENKLIKLSRVMIDRGYFQKLKYVHCDSSKGGWYHYDGRHWRPDVSKHHEIVLKQFYHKHKQYEPTDENYISDLPKLSDCQRWNGLLRIVRTEPEITCEADDFDENHELLNLENCTLVLDSGKFREHSPDDMLTKMMKASYDKAAKCTRFEQFIDEIFSGNTEVIEFMQRYLGYCLGGSTLEQIFVFFHGAGSNGKSVLTETLYNLFGDYGQKISTQAITYSRRGSEKDRQEQIYSGLKGIRLAFATETGQNMKLDESAVKDLTGGESITARELYASYESYKPIFKFIMSGNYKPVISGTDLGIWRRIRLVSFERTFTGDEIDPQLLEKLLNERDGILQWLLRGYEKWREKGLGDLPETIQAAINEYRSESDILGQYIEERLIRVPDAVTETDSIYTDYKDWMDSNGYLRSVKKRKLTSELVKRGYTRDNSDIHHPVFIGIGLLTANQ